MARTKKNITFEAKIHPSVEINAREGKSGKYWVIKDSDDVRYMCFDENLLTVIETCLSSSEYFEKLKLHGYISFPKGSTFLTITSFEVFAIEQGWVNPSKKEQPEHDNITEVEE